MKSTVLTCVILMGALTAAWAQHGHSPYAGQESRPIKSLSAAETNQLLNAEGMGLAKAAELNGYPGPKHVLELAEPLKLTPTQVAATEAIYLTPQQVSQYRRLRGYDSPQQGEYLHSH